MKGGPSYQLELGK